MPTGGYRHAATAFAASSAVLMSGTMMPYAPRSSAFMIVAGSFHGTRTTGTVSVCEIAWSIGQTSLMSVVPCCMSTQRASKPCRAMTSAVNPWETESQPSVTNRPSRHICLILFGRTVAPRVVEWPVTRRARSVAHARGPGSGALSTRRLDNLNEGTQSSPVPRLLLALLLTLALITPATAAPEGQLTYALHISLATRWLDPGDLEGLITPFVVFYALHDAVVKSMPGTMIAPSLAESWTVSKDGTVVDFALRKGVTFHNGDPFTAEDVQFSFQRYKGSQAKLLKERVREVEVVNPHRVRFHLAGPWPDFLTVYGTPATGAGWIVPKRYVEKVGDAGFLKAPVGLGPYRFVSFKPGVELVLEANETYWRRVPSVKRLVMKVVPDESTRLAMLKRREADVAYGLLGPMAQEVPRGPSP